MNFRRYKWSVLPLVAVGLMAVGTDVHAEEEHQDYILDREMTEEEIERQQAFEPELEEIPEDNTGALPDYNIGAVTSSVQSNINIDQMRSYDARNDGLITPVKQQGSYNMCWAYSAISLAETSMIKNGLILNGETSRADNTDLSEWQLAYFTYNTGEDRLGGTVGDSTKILYSGAADIGGSNTFTTFALANWTGVSEEAVAPYESIGEGVLAPHLAVGSAAHLKQAYWMNSSDIEAMKQAIYECGSITTKYYHNSIYLNYSTGAYNYNKSGAGANHTVTIVGWDDDYSAENFLEGHRPSSNGAWLVKNSWGSEWLADENGQNGGYFWLSYEDGYLNGASGKAFAYIFGDASEYDHNYQYDGSCGAFISATTKDTGYRVKSGQKLADIYQIPKDSNFGSEELKAVSFALYAANVEYSIQIYKDLEDISDPESGKAVFEEPVTGNTSYIGYYTVDLPAGVEFMANDRFSVVITLKSADGSDISYFVDKSYQNSNWVKFVSHTEPDQSFYSDDNGWNDLNVQGVCARIKAFTSDTDHRVHEVEVKAPEGIYYDYQKSMSLSAHISPENAYNKGLVWTSSDEDVATVDENGLVSFVSAGKAEIIATAIDGSGVSGKCSIDIKQSVEDIALAEEDIVVGQGDTVAIAYKAAPETAYNKNVIYQSQDIDIAVVDDDGNITGIAPGEVEIIVTAEDGSGMSSICNVMVVEGEEGPKAPQEPEKPSEDDNDPYKRPLHGNKSGSSEAPQEDKRDINSDNNINQDVIVIEETTGSANIQSEELNNRRTAVTAPKTSDETNEAGWILLTFLGITFVMAGCKKYFK